MTRWFGLENYRVYDPNFDGTLGTDDDGNFINVPPANPQDQGLSPFGTIAMPQFFQNRASHGTRERFGVNGQVEFRPSEKTQLWLRGFYTSYDDFEDLRDMWIRWRTSTLGNLSRFRLLTEKTGYTTRARLFTKAITDLQERPVDQIVFGGRHRFGDAWTVEANLNFTHAEENHPADILIETRNRLNCENRRNSLGPIPENACVTFDYSGFWPIIRLGPSVNAAFDGRSWPNPDADLTDLDFFPVHRDRYSTSFVNEETWSFDIDVQWEGKLFGNNRTRVKFGFKRLERDKSVDDSAFAFIRDRSTEPYLSDVAGDGSEGNFGELYASVYPATPLGPQSGPDAGYYAEWLSVVQRPQAFRNDEAFHGDFFTIFRTQYNPETNTPDPDSLVPAGSPWRWDDASSRGNSVEDDYVLVEEVNAFYIMGDVEFSERLNVIGGVRVEWTDTNIRSFSTVRQDGGSRDIVPLDPVDKNYSNVLPNFQIRYELNDNLLLRGAVTWMIARPDYIDISRRAEFEFDGVTVDGQPAGYFTAGSVGEGNPDLNPYESFNADASLTYYFPNGSGLISAGFFYKKIDNGVYSFSYTPTDPSDQSIQFAGKEFERGTVTDPLGESVDVVFFRGVALDELTFSTVNNTDRGEIKGVEFTVQRHFDFLPKPLDGFGITANFAFIDSEVEIFQRPGEVLPYFQQPDEVFNVQLYYQKGGFEARLAWRRQGEALEQVGPDIYWDVYSYPQEILDLKVSYQINQHWGVYFSASNLTDEADRSWAGNDRNTIGGFSGLGRAQGPGYEIWGTTYKVGATWRFGR